MTSKYFLLTTLSLLTLSACTSSPVSTEKAIPIAQLTYEHLNAIPVDVKKINFSSMTDRGSRAWDIASNMPTPPDIAMRRYLENRFKPISGHGVLNITLTKATISYDETPNEIKILSILPIANQHDYTFEIVIDIEGLYLSGLPDRRTTKRYLRKVKLPPQVTVSYREAYLQRAMEKMMVDIDENLTLTLANEFNLIRRANIPTKQIPVKTEEPKPEDKYLNSRGSRLNKGLQEDWANWYALNHGRLNN